MHKYDSDYEEKMKRFHRAYEIQPRLVESEEKIHNYPWQKCTREEYEEYERLSEESHSCYMEDYKEWVSIWKIGALAGVGFTVAIELLIFVIATLLFLS